jgi:hypothetical protein
MFINGPWVTAWISWRKKEIQSFLILFTESQGATNIVTKLK